MFVAVLVLQRNFEKSLSWNISDIMSEYDVWLVISVLLPISLFRLHDNMPIITPGFAFITRVFGCYNYRVLDPVRKPKTITFDAEIPIGENPEGDLQCVKGIVHYFVPSQEKSPIDDHKYFVSGKIVSISEEHHNEENDLLDYDFQIEALTVCLIIIIFLYVYLTLLNISFFLCLTSMTHLEAMSRLWDRCVDIHVRQVDHIIIFNRPLKELLIGTSTSTSLNIS